MPLTNNDTDNAESYKQRGNDSFVQHNFQDAIQQYSHAIVLIDKQQSTPIVGVAGAPSSTPTSSSTTTTETTHGSTNVRVLKCTLLSNRALSRIKRYETTTTTTTKTGGTGETDTDTSISSNSTLLLTDAIEDCQLGLTVLMETTNESSSSSSSSPQVQTVLRTKLLYRSARARFLLANDASTTTTNTSESSSSSSSSSVLLQEAAKDLLLLLQMDPKHVEGNTLMKMIRTQHHQSSVSFSSSPIGKILTTLHTNSATGSRGTSATTTEDVQQQDQQLKLLLGLIQNDPISSSMEIGRFTVATATTKHTHNHNNGVDILWRLIQRSVSSVPVVVSRTLSSSSSSNNSLSSSLLGMQCISTMASHSPMFVRTYLLSVQSSLTILCATIKEFLFTTTTTNTTERDNNGKIIGDLIVSILSVWHFIILHADRDKCNISDNKSSNNSKNDPTTATTTDNEIVGTTNLQYDDILQTLTVVLQIGQYYVHRQQQSVLSTLLYRAVMDIVSVFLASTDRDHRIRMSLISSSSSSSSSSNHSNNNNSNLNRIDPELERLQSPEDIRNLSPSLLAAYKKRQYDIKTRNEAWAYERAKLLCGSNVSTSTSSNGRSILQQLLQVAVSYCTTDDIIVRREITISISRILSCLEPDTLLQDTVRPYLQNNDHIKAEDVEPYIEEIYTDEDGKEVGSVDKKNDNKSSSSTAVELETKMIRAVIATAILLLSSKKECATWVLGNGGWVTVSDDMDDMIHSQNVIALCYVVEMIQAAAVLEATRTIVTGLIGSGSMEVLMKSNHRDVRSGAAAAIAKLGLSDKVTSKDDGELMGLLQAACELFEDRDTNTTTDESKKDASNGKDTNAYNQYSSYATSSVERAVEMITYLVAHTTIKEEIAAGFGGSSGTPVIELLLQSADQPGAGESMSGFSLASIFQLIAATNEQIRKEAFEGKEVTMEQYDEMQRMGKTEEEKDVMDLEKDTDTKEACQERIRKMAAANVPRALVALTENASEHTLEQLTMAMNRMAEEASVRGIMIQQGVLSTCIKIEKAEGPTETDIMKKVIRMARHCIAKMLITTNPSLLTSAQKLGAVKPLVLLIRDIKASDLQHFEALLAITNIGSSGDDAKNRIVSERGISTFHFAMFSDHELVRRSATEALCNLVPHEKMMEHLAEVDHLRLWLAFAVDCEDHYECARAAAGCLAMATQDETIAQTLTKLDKFKIQMMSLLESGRLEIMHRTFVILYNLVLHGSEIKQVVIDAGLIDFCRAYIELQQHVSVSVDDFSVEERNLIPVTVEIAKTIVQATE